MAMKISASMLILIYWELVDISEKLGQEEQLIDRPLQNINDIDESKIVEVYDNLVWYKLPLDNGWTSYTLRAVDCMHDNVEIYNKDNVYSDDGYTLGINFSHIPSERYDELRPIVKWYGCRIEDDGEVVKADEVEAFLDVDLNTVACGGFRVFVRVDKVGTASYCVGPFNRVVESLVEKGYVELLVA